MCASQIRRWSQKSRIYITGKSIPNPAPRLDTPELELEADIWWFCSTHGYYKTTKYQLSSLTLTMPTRNRVFQDFALLSKILSFADTFKSPFLIFGASGQLQRALTLRFGGVRRQTWYLGTPTSSILSIFEVFMIPRLFWNIFFRGSKYFALFSKKVPPPELNFAEKISDRDFSKLRQKFSKRLNLSNVIWLKFIWFKYELLTPTESKIRASRAFHLLFVQGVVFFGSHFLNP